MRISCESWAIQKRWPLSRGIDRAGPCPVCGGTDRFAIHTKLNTFNCRRCEIKGGGVIDLVMATEGIDFTRACEIITGREASAPIDEAAAAAARAHNEAEDRRRANDEARYREEARKRGWTLWNRSFIPAWVDEPTAVVAYLRRRGIDFPGEAGAAIATQLKLGEIPSHPWVEKQGSTYVTVHEGPAMIAAIQQPNGKFGAVHQTWLDLSQPKGKLVLPPAADGSERPSKKVMGIKKGGAIRLFTPKSPRRIVMGEGIETTLTALAHSFEPETAYWAGVDLGNMSGKDARDDAGGHLWDQPDLADRDCFLPPEWCEELVYLCDSDEARNHTEEKVIRGLRRASALRDFAREGRPELPALTVSYVPPLGGGQDLNDLVRVSS